MNNSKIEYLLGKKSELNEVLQPYSREVVNFLDDFSKLIYLKKI